MEAVAGAMLFENDRRVAKSEIVKKVCFALMVMWTVFTAGPMIENSLEAWGHIAAAIEAPQRPTDRQVANGDEGRVDSAVPAESAR